MKICRDIVLVIYPLINKKTRKESGLYTMTAYDLYKYKKDKYVRGEPIFYAEDLTNKPDYYRDINNVPMVIEDCDLTDWKFEYDTNIFGNSANGSDKLLKAYLSRELLKR